MKANIPEDRKEERIPDTGAGRFPQPLEDEAVGAVSGGMVQGTLWCKKQRMGEKIGEDPLYKD